MFDGLRDEVDKARWKQRHRRQKQIAAKALAVRRSRVFLALPMDESERTLVVYFWPETPTHEEWCIRVDAAGGYAVGEPIRFSKYGEWIAHAKERRWEQEWV